MTESAMTLEELAGRLDDPALVVLDVRTPAEYDGLAGAPCDPRQGHIPGARNADVAELFAAASADALADLVGEPAGAEVVCYCHVGSRSEVAAQLLAAAGYRARNYAGSWHEWSRRHDLPVDATP